MTDSPARAGGARTLAQLGRQPAGRRRGRAAPTSADEVAAVLASAAAAGRRVRPIGSGHSFTGIGVPEDVQLVCDGLVGIRSVDRRRPGHRRRGDDAAPAQRRAASAAAGR